MRLGEVQLSARSHKGSNREARRFPGAERHTHSAVPSSFVRPTPETTADKSGRFSRGLTQGYWLLAIGYWLLAIGYWLLAIGYWLLAIGYWLLAIGYRLSAIGYRLSIIAYRLFRPPVNFS
jgi:hypothetical protein